MSVEQKERLKPAKEAVMFLLYRDGKFLFETPRDKTSSYFGMLKVPSGKLEPGEIDTDGVVREMGEEMGVNPTEMVYLESFVNETPDGQEFLVYSYLVLGVEGQVVNKQPEKTSHFQLSSEEAYEQLELEESIRTLRLAESYLIEEAQSKG